MAGRPRTTRARYEAHYGQQRQREDRQLYDLYATGRVTFQMMADALNEGHPERPEINRKQIARRVALYRKLYGLPAQWQAPRAPKNPYAGPDVNSAR